MKLEINELNHNFIVRIVIFSVFLFKRKIRNINYNLFVISFVNKKIPWNIDLNIDVGIKLSQQEERELFLNELLNDDDNDYLRFIKVSFVTPLKKVTMIIDITNELCYEKYLYL